MELGRSSNITRKNSDPVPKFFLNGGWGGQCSESNIFKLLELSETSLAR